MEKMLNSLGQCCSNFMWSLLGARERKIAKMDVVQASMPKYGKNVSESSSPEPTKPWALIFTQIMRDRRATKIAKIMVLC